MALAAYLERFIALGAVIARVIMASRPQSVCASIAAPSHLWATLELKVPWCDTIRIRDIHVGAEFHEQVNRRNGVFHKRVQQGYSAKTVLMIRIRAGLEKEATQLDTRNVHGAVAQSDDIRQVDRRAAFDEILERVKVGQVGRVAAVDWTDTLRSSNHESYVVKLVRSLRSFEIWGRASFDCLLTCLMRQIIRRKQGSALL